MVCEPAGNLLRAHGNMLRMRAALLAENALPRQEVIILRRAVPRPRLEARDRATVTWVIRGLPAGGIPQVPSKVEHSRYVRERVPGHCSGDGLPAGKVETCPLLSQVLQ